MSEAPAARHARGGRGDPPPPPHTHSHARTHTLSLTHTLTHTLSLSHTHTHALWQGAAQSPGASRGSVPFDGRHPHGLGTCAHSSHHASGQVTSHANEDAGLSGRDGGLVTCAHSSSLANEERGRDGHAEEEAEEAGARACSGACSRRHSLLSVSPPRPISL